MQVTVEILDGLERKMFVKLPSENLEEKVEKRLKEIAPSVQISGFRPGKVPFTIVRQRFENSIRGEVLSAMIGDSYQEALKQENIIPAGHPHLKLTESAPGKEIEYEARFEVYPTIQLNNLDGVEIETAKVTVTDHDVQEVLEKIRKQYAKWLEVDRPAQSGDRVVIDFDSRIDGESFAGGTNKNAVLDLGSQSAIPGFEEGLMGATKNQQLELTLNFPADYYNQAIAGKSALANVTVHRILTPELPELDDAFASKLDVKEGGIEQLKIEVRENMERDIAQKTREDLKKQLTEQFLAANPIAVPNALIQEEAVRLEQQAEQSLKQQGQKKVSLDPAKFLTAAAHRIKLGLLFGEFIKVHQLKLDPARVESLLKELTAHYQDPQAIIDAYRNNPESRKQLENAVLEEQVFDALAAQVSKVERELTYPEWLQKQRA